jgi:drug/metabolite transporter (DMT)-like permease
MTSETRAWLQIHLCVLLWGFTAILGKLITLEAFPLVWWRMAMVSAMLALAPGVWRSARALPFRHVAAFAGVGALLAAHWVTFYGSIKLANASVAATCMALCPVFLAAIEPVIARRAFALSELLLGVAALGGVALVVGGIPERMHVGLAVGAVSALLAALFTVINKRLLDRAAPLTMTAMEIGSGWVLLTLVVPLTAAGTSVFARPDRHDAVLLIVLSLACTLVPFALSLVALRHISAFGSMLAVNLEPVYAIVLAVILFGEQHDVTPRFYLGVTIIVAAVLAYPVMQRRTS